ncbi:MAG TPA: GNAT family N-acetyltransferase [Candidatus Baltobacteraceae bacterium]|nr:GNAT family N-acetyltransferase [Candidatus Baltobacteraceae bacterium]
MNSTPPLQTTRLDLEPVRSGHAQEAWPQFDDERMWRYFPSARPSTVDDLRERYERWERGSPHADQVWRNWLCRDRASGAAIGVVQATIFPQEAASHIAYAIFSVHQRNGYAREAAQAVIDYVKGSYGVERFFAEMDTRNEASYRLAESLGFVRVETRIDEYLYELTV